MEPVKLFKPTPSMYVALQNYGENISPDSETICSMLKMNSMAVVQS